MCHAQSVLTNNPDRRKATANGQRTIVAVAKQDEFLNLIALSNDQRGAVQSGQNPHPTALTKRSSGVQGRFLGVEEWLKPGKRLAILQDGEARADHA